MLDKYKVLLSKNVYIFFTCSAFFISYFSYGQTGTLKGTIKDEKTGEPLIGSSITIKGTTSGTLTDFNGNFEISKLNPGTYTFTVSLITYLSKEIPNVTIHPNQTTDIDVTLTQNVQGAGEVTVTARRQGNTDLAVIAELKKADLVAIGISSQQIRTSQDRNAGQVIRRLPGITITNNRFVNVRGLNERYSIVMLNGIIAPSSEVDSKAFSFDLIPSSMLDRILVYKSASAELPGEMAGSVIDIHTKNSIEENGMDVSLSGFFRQGTTGKDAILSTEKSSLDWIGYGSSARKLPAGFPSENLRLYTSNNPQLWEATKSLPNRWGKRNLSVFPDTRINLNLRRYTQLGNTKLSNTTSISYTASHQLLKVEQNYYDAYHEAEQKSSTRFRFHDVRFQQTNRIGGLSNFILEINPKHRIEWLNFFNQQGQNRSTLRSGFEDHQGFEVKNESFNYSARTLYSGQFIGKHDLSKVITLSWNGGYNYTSAQQPDYRRIRSQRQIGSDDIFMVVIPPNSSSIDAGRFYSSLKETTYTAKAQISYKINTKVDHGNDSKWVTGFYVEDKNRSFDARWMSYKWASLSNINQDILAQPFDQVFSSKNLYADQSGYFLLDEGTNLGPSNYDRYQGKSQLISIHTGITTSLSEKIRLAGGIRLEHNVQRIYVHTLDNSLEEKTNNVLTLPMPSLNLSYHFSQDMLVRVAYGRTVNRPVFRELAPFNYYDFDRNSDLIGNPNLKSATIDNIDVRWELYPEKGESIHLGAFYKHFNNPIEQYLERGSNLIYGYTNADHASSYGIEAEVRKSLKNVLNSSFLQKISIVFNAAFIKSTIQLPSSMDHLDNNRAMQGQSPYVFNTGLHYTNLALGWNISLQHNVFGPRIFAVGDKDLNPTQYEMPRHQIDFTLIKKVSNKIDIKAGVRDILNQPYRLIQDSDRDTKITPIDEPIQRFSFGSYASLGFVWHIQ